MERRPDVDGAALGALLRRLLGPDLTVARTPEGVAAQVYRVEAAGRVLYARIAEQGHEDLSVDAALLDHLRREGLHVPEVVHVEPFDDALGRSVLLMAEVPGRAAYAEFVASDLPDPWPGRLGSLFPARELDRFWSLVAGERGRHLAGGRLAHGDFDTTPIIQVEGCYTGLIDFGEIRGTEPLYDLGHFALHDRERLPMPLLADLLAGYGEVAVLPPDHRELIRRSAILLGLRQLARWLGPFRNLPSDHPAATGRAARLRQLLDAPGLHP